MTIELPTPILGYYAADSSADPDGVLHHFTTDATVTDESKIYVGHDAIRTWMIESAKKYSYVVKPFAIANEAGLMVVSAHLTGNFPGSPVDLRYCFGLDGDKIARLDIGV